MNRKIIVSSILLLAGLVIAGASGALVSLRGTNAADEPINTQSSVKENSDIMEHTDLEGSGADDGNKTDQETVDDGNVSDESAQLHKYVKVTIEDAKKTALLAVPGTIVKAEQKNEKENVVYNIEIINGKTISAVKIDAVTGNVLEKETED